MQVAARAAKRRVDKLVGLLIRFDSRPAFRWMKQSVAGLFVELAARKCHMHRCRFADLETVDSVWFGRVADAMFGFDVMPEADIVSAVRRLLDELPRVPGSEGPNTIAPPSGPPAWFTEGVQVGRVEEQEPPPLAEQQAEQKVVSRCCRVRMSGGRCSACGNRCGLLEV